MGGIDPGQPYIMKVPDVLSPDECAALIRRIEGLNPEAAPINTVSGPRVNRDIRNNDRVIFDDQELADRLLARVKGRAPQEIHGWSLIGANERLRCYRYKPGMRFRPHTDGSFQRSDDERSYYSFLVYLNDDFEGGCTTFITEPEVAIQPRIGLGLIFQHPIVHEGSVVTAGVKYVARTDLMYRND